VPPVLKLGRETAPAIAVATLGLLLVLAALVAHADGGTWLARAGAAAARGEAELVEETIDPSPVVDTPIPTTTQPPPTPTALGLIRAVEAPTIVPTATAAPSTTPTLAPSPTPAAARAKPGAGVPILMYHYIRVNPDPADQIGFGLSVPPAAFAAHMGFLAEREYRVVAMRELEAYLGTGRVPDEKTVVLTLDDGYRDAYTEAWPVLRRHGFRGTIYVISDLVDNHRYLTVGQLQELHRAGMEIGSHSVSHADLAAVGPDRLRREVFESKAALERLLGGPVTSFCYPAGRSSPAARAAVASAGYRSALTVEPGIFRGREDRLAIPRVRVHGGMGLTALARALGESPPDPVTWAGQLADRIR
jgi:peptidoglycan/xylan/chitin deacetylase (PgdA/CDA1 family)